MNIALEASKPALIVALTTLAEDKPGLPLSCQPLKTTEYGDWSPNPQYVCGLCGDGNKVQKSSGLYNIEGVRLARRSSTIVLLSA